MLYIKLCDFTFNSGSAFLTTNHNQVSRSSSVPPNTRDALYQGLPPSIKSALRPKLLSFQVKEEVCILFVYYNR